MQRWSPKYAPANKTVLTASSSQIVAPDSAMRSLCIINKDSANSIWLAFGNHEAVSGNGIEIQAGEQGEWGSDAIPVDGINAIADTADVAVAIQKG